jgi:hypothetical protein
MTIRMISMTGSALPRISNVRISMGKMGVQSCPPRTRYIFLYLYFLKRDLYGQNAVPIKTQSVIVLGKCIAFMNHESLVRPCLADRCKDAVTYVGHVCFF